MGIDPKLLADAKAELKLFRTYFRMNPCATEQQVREKGYDTALDVLYGGDIEKAAADLLPFMKHMERMLTYIAFGEVTA